MTLVDSAPCFGVTPHSLSIQGMHGNAIKEKGLFLTSLPLSRATRRLDSFPPPLQSPTVCDANFSHLAQVDRVSFTCVRTQGRFILIEKPQPSSLPPRSIRSHRHNGRLQLRLYVGNTEQTPLQQEKSMVQVPYEQHQHSSLEKTLKCTVQGQHRGLEATNLMDQMSLARNTPLQLPAVHSSLHRVPTTTVTPRHMSMAMHNPTVKQDERKMIVMHELPERINAAPVSSHQPFSMAESFSPDLHPSRLKIDLLPEFSRKRLSAKGFAGKPIQNTLYAGIGEKDKRKAGNAWAQEQRELVARIAFEIERGQRRLSMGEKFSLPEDFHDSPDAEKKRGEREGSKERNPSAETADPEAGIDRKREACVQKAREGDSSTGGNGTAKDQRKRENGRQENRRDEKGRRWLMEGDTTRVIELTTERSFSGGSHAYLRTSLRPLSMLNR